METKDRLFVSIFPNGKWICSSKNGDTINSESSEENISEFSSRYDTSLEALMNAHIFDCSKDLATAPVEFKNESTGANIFTDRGKLISFDRARVTDEEIRLALVHAEQKFGGKITLSGDDLKFTERMARLADDMGITVLNPEMQPAIFAHRESLAQSAPSVAPPKTSKRVFWRRVLTWWN